MREYLEPEVELRWMQGEGEKVAMEIEVVEFDEQCAEEYPPSRGSASSPGSASIHVINF